MEQFLKQLDELLAEYKEFKKNFKDVDSSVVYSFITRSRSAVNRIAGQESVYMAQFKDIIAKKWNMDSKANYLAGVVEALRKDVASGYLQSHTELIHGELFSDFIEMSQHLLDEGYKDASAVIAGSSLEAHLRQLCIKNGIDTESKTSKGIKPKKADLLNSELTKADVYSKLDQKNVTAWLDLRNKAAHGKYDEYEKAQIAILVTSIRDFLTRNPA